MRRREFTAGLGSAVAWTPAARAQQPTPMRRIGWLSSVSEDYPEMSANFAEFRKGLAQFGWIEGRNIRIDYRWYAGDRERLSNDAAELARLSPALIVAMGGAAVGRLLEVTRTVPIVFVEVNDPVARGFVESLRRSGGNATGFTYLEYETSAKWLEMLKRIAPILTRVAVLGNFSNNDDGRRQLEAVRSAAPSLGVQLEPYEVSTAGDIKRAIESFVRGPTDGMIVTENIQTAVHRDLIVRLAAEHRLPAIYFSRHFVVGGGLLSYAPSVGRQYLAAASYVNRILSGEQPADLPVQQPTKYELIINLKTAKTLGLTIPPSILALADEVIE